MLHKFKIIQALQEASKDFFVGFAQEIDIAQQIWFKISQDDNFVVDIHRNRQPLLIPFWKGLLNQYYTITRCNKSYSVLSVDGSQIYYDKHQGPPCFLINIGFMQLSYRLPQADVSYGSDPVLYTKLDEHNDYGSVDFVNMQREACEFMTAFEKMNELYEKFGKHDALCLFDGSLIFFNIDAKNMDLKELFLDQYCTVLQKFYERNMLIAGYMSLPKTKELVNLCKLALVQGDYHALEQTNIIDRLLDTDIAALYLQKGQRSVVFKSLAPITYLYPQHLKPYFCYLHVGIEIVRIEFPKWIASCDDLVNKVCSIAYDQALKGQGYPVSLFEAHEQAVVKSLDRHFFYMMVEKMSQKQLGHYVVSQKNMKKYKPIV